jgi:hypothetical protein
METMRDQLLDTHRKREREREREKKERKILVL